MTRLSWRTRLGVALLVGAVLLMAIHYAIFRDFHHIAIYTVHDIAFLPVEVLVVTLIIHSLLERRAHQEMMRKLSMVIGAFFSEVGSDLLRRVSEMDEEVEVREHFLVGTEWHEHQFETAKKVAASYDYGVAPDRDDLLELCDFLTEKRGFLLGLLQNPNLLEHETFTDALWAVFHLTDELDRRDDLREIPETDVQHLAGDVQRAYAAIAVEWLDHMQHLRDAYPYLFSLAVRTNPLDTGRTVVVEA